MKNSILRNLILFLITITTVPCTGQFNLSELAKLSDPVHFSDLTTLSTLLPRNIAAIGSELTKSTGSQFDYIGYTLDWDFQTSQYDTATREELVSEVIDGKTNWLIVAEELNDSTGSYEPAVKVEYYNVRVPDDPDDVTFAIADSILFFAYDALTEEYELFISMYYVANKNNQIEFSETTIILYGLPFINTVSRNYYNGEGRIISQNTETTSFVGDSRDTITFVYNELDQLEREVLLTFDSYYTGVVSSSITDHSYNGDNSRDFSIIRLYSDSLMTLASVDSIAFMYHSPDSYTESFYYYEFSMDSFLLGYYWDYMSTDDTETSAQYRESGYGIYNAQYFETSFDECERAVEGLSIVGNPDGTEESRERTIWMYRKEPACTVSTSEAVSVEKQFSFSNDGQLLTVHFEQQDQGTISMFTIDGKTVGSVKYDGINGGINISRLASGIYYVVVSGIRTSGVAGVFIN